MSFWGGGSVKDVSLSADESQNKKLSKRNVVGLPAQYPHSISISGSAQTTQLCWLAFSPLLPSPPPTTKHQNLSPWLEPQPPGWSLGFLLDFLIGFSTKWAEETSKLSIKLHHSCAENPLQTFSFTHNKTMTRVSHFAVHITVHWTRSSAFIKKLMRNE